MLGTSRDLAGSSGAEVSRRREPRSRRSGGASLDGDPPASVVVATLAAKVRGGEASSLAWWWHRSVLADAAIGSPSKRCRPATVLSTASRARDSTSDALCRAPLRSGQGSIPARSQIRLRRRLVKDDDFVGPERLPSTSALLREPATVLTTSPPRAGFRRPFAPRAPGRFPFQSRGARPFAFPLGPGAARRLLQPKQSASTRCGSFDPRPAPRRLPSCLRSGWGRASLATDQKTRNEPTQSQSRFHGPGAGVAFTFPAPRVAIAHNESFAPTRSTRTPHVVES
jgi:hypothetical protein